MPVDGKGIPTIGLVPIALSHVEGSGHAEGNERARGREGESAAARRPRQSGLDAQTKKIGCE